MDLRIAHADAAGEEIRFLDHIIEADIQIDIRREAELDDNTFYIQLPAEEWQQEPILKGHRVYIEGTEWGGVVERIEHDTAENVVSLYGATWRGMLFRKVIEPPDGFAYLDVTDEANAVIDLLMAGFDGYFEIDDADTGINITGSWRYRRLHEALEQALEIAGLSLEVGYQGGKPTVGARAVTDHSETVELSQDYGIDMLSFDGRFDGYNHVIALGAGVLLDRDILHIYRDDDGTMTLTPPAWAGTVKDQAITYDYGNAETLDELAKGAVKRLEEQAPLAGVVFDFSRAQIDIPLGDIVGARDRLSGMAVKARVTSKILTIRGPEIRIDTEVS